MKCPFCDYSDSRVLESRPTEDDTAVRRRRECPKCAQRFTTYERLEEAPFLVVKKDGRREMFSRQKVLSGLVKACEKRPIALFTLEEAAYEIEKQLRGIGKNEITSVEIGEKVMERLKSLDDVAYVRFASVYREFRDLGGFREEVERLLAERLSRPNKDD